MVKQGVDVPSIPSAEGGLEDGGLDAAAPSNAPVSDFTFQPTLDSSAPIDSGKLPRFCASTSVRGTPRTLDLYFMLDLSGSMDDETGTGITKWQAVKDALSGFVTDKASFGFSVALQYFPLPPSEAPPRSCQKMSDCMGQGVCPLAKCAGVGAWCTDRSDCQNIVDCVPLKVCEGSNDPCPENGDPCPLGAKCVPRTKAECLVEHNCVDTDYSVPAVGPVSLPEPLGSSSVLASLKDHMPKGETPTASALRGALLGAKDMALRHPDHGTAVVLVTDGLPTACSPQNPADIAALAQMASDAADPILTFVVGVFSPTEYQEAQSNLDLIAEGGGTGTAVIIDSSKNVAKTLLETLHTIRSSALSCKLDIPKSDGGFADLDKAIVQFTSSKGTPLVIPRVANADECNANGGWYYERPANSSGPPTNISLCSQSCRTMRKNPGGRIDVMLGCQDMIR